MNKISYKIANTYSDMTRQAEEILQSIWINRRLKGPSSCGRFELYEVYRSDNPENVIHFKLIKA